MRLFFLILFNISVSYFLSAQGLTRNGQSTSTGTNFVSKNGQISGTPVLSKYGQELIAHSGLQSGLEGYWTLDEVSGNAIDRTGVHNGNPSGITQGIPGKIGTGYNFLKSNRSYVYFGSIPLTINSISLWARRSSSNANECLIGFGSNHTGLWIGAEGNIYLSNNNGERVATWGRWSETSTLHHVVLITSSTGSAGRIELYLDGISQGLRSCPASGITNFVIGSEYANGAFNSPDSFSGDVDEIGLWNRVLTSSEVRDLYGQGAGQTYPFSGTNMPDVSFYIQASDWLQLLHSVGNKRIMSELKWPNQYIRFSNDNGVSYNQGITLPWQSIKNARILGNGNIVLFNGTKFYYSTDNLATINPCNVLDKNGMPYSFHAPVNSAYPGGYFDIMGGFAEDKGVMVLGNYTNSATGASPINLYYSLNGITWKVFYTFGQSPIHTDNGTQSGGTGGILLGDPNNSLLTRHIHAVNIGGDGNFYASMGDGANEEHFLRCTYDRTNDRWEVIDLLNENSRNWQRMRSLGVFERNGYLYWGSDGTGSFTFGGVRYNCYGIYKCAAADINDPSKHILLQSLPDVCYSFLNVGNIVFAGMQSHNYIYISFDYGETWSSYPKPPYLNGSVEGVWYNDLYKFFGTSSGLIVTSELF